MNYNCVDAAQIKEAVLNGVSLEDDKKDQFNKIQQVCLSFMMLLLKLLGWKSFPNLTGYHLLNEVFVFLLYVQVSSTCLILRTIYAPVVDFVSHPRKKHMHDASVSKLNMEYLS